MNNGGAALILLATAAPLGLLRRLQELDLGRTRQTHARSVRLGRVLGQLEHTLVLLDVNRAHVRDERLLLA